MIDSIDRIFMSIAERATAEEVCVCVYEAGCERGRRTLEGRRIV